MRRVIILAAVLLAIAVPVCANDSPTATKFLRDYVGALRLTRAGDALAITGGCVPAREQYAQARILIDPYTISSELEMKQAATLVLNGLDARDACPAPIDTTPGQVGPLAESAVRASWALVRYTTSWARVLAIRGFIDGSLVGFRDRRHAIRELEQAFGPVAKGPRADQSDLEIAAATLAYFLAHPPEPIRGELWYRGP